MDVHYSDSIHKLSNHNTGQIGRANDNPLIKIESLDADDIAKADGYDMVFVQAMGLRLTEEQRAELEKAMKNGTPVVSTLITNPDNDFCSVDTANANRMKAYIDNGGRENYHNLLSYVRKYIDKKKLSMLLNPERW